MKANSEPVSPAQSRSETPAQAPLLHISDGERSEWWDHFDAELLFEISRAKAAQRDSASAVLKTNAR